MSCMIFYVIPNMTRENTFRVTSALFKILDSLNCTAVMDSSLKNDFKDFPDLVFEDEKSAVLRADAVISIGGDGSFINAAKRATACNKPVLCINAGKLAYLACLECNELPLIEKVLKGEFVTEKRMMLDVSIVDKNKKVLYHSNCINDAVVSRGGSIRVMKLSVSCNGAPLIHYTADGVIISTPTGSTAYSLSAGGPIVEPVVESMILTPVCPHSIFSRSVVLGGESVLDIEHDNSGEAILSCDGQEAVKIPEGASVSVKKSDAYASFIKIKSDTFIDVLNKKLSD